MHTSPYIDFRRFFVFPVVTLACLLLPQLLHAQQALSSASNIPKYGLGSWDRTTLGNHRVVVHVSSNADAVWAHLIWRRRDIQPDQKEIIVVDTQTQKRVRNVARIRVTQYEGDLVFQPTSGAGDYAVYFMPFTGNLESSYPKISYPAPTETADAAWLSRNHLNDRASALSHRGDFPVPDNIRFESINEFNQFTPMELIASPGELQVIRKQSPSSTYFVFPEDRHLSIRMTDNLPVKWVVDGPEHAFTGTGDKNEFYAFQLGVWAAQTDIENVQVAFPTLVSLDGKFSIPPSNFRCFNLGGVNAAGQSFTSVVNVAKGKVQALWCGVQIPKAIPAGEYSGKLMVSASNAEKKTVLIHLNVTDHIVRNHGDDDPYRMSRLRWLDSRLAFDDAVVPPYTPIQVSGRRLSVLGRNVLLGSDGLPESIESKFAIEMTGLTGKPRKILAAPIALLVKDTRGNPIPLTGTRFRFLKQSPGVVSWQVTGDVGSLREQVHGTMEFDGSIDFTVAFTSKKRVAVQDIQLEIPYAADVAKYAMGLGYKGAAAPQRYDWKWSVERNQDSAWIGDVNAGLQFSLRDNKYVRPLNTNFYHSQPLVMPASWDNGGKGGCHLASQDGKPYIVNCYSGPRAFAAGETQYYNFRLLVTPFHPIQPDMQWKDRYFHAYQPPHDIAATGANVINIHHATPINPFINYPFLRVPEMTSYVQQAHQLGMKVKIYYTVRELTNHAPEIFALDSLNGEVLAKGPGGGSPWLQEHIPGSYLAGWHVPPLEDSALVTTGTSRWLNFYVEGMRWLVENEHIDGLYLDDIAFDRVTMERIRKVLLRGNAGGLIDVHSANQYDLRDGYASSANLYMEQFPFIDRLWFGEYFDYNSPPDYWLVEISGIPFGLMGEMLQDGGNPWRGMVYGMTTRLPHSGDPRPIWKFWDQYGIEKDRMIGYWVPNSPVKTDRKDVLATIYRGRGRTMIALASWDKDPTTVKLVINYKALGLKPSQVHLFAPEIDNFQQSKQFQVDEPVPVAPGKGWLLVLENK